MATTTDQHFRPHEIADRLERFGGYSRISSDGNSLHLFGFDADGTELLKTARVMAVGQTVKIHNRKTDEILWIPFATIDALLPEITQ